MIRNGPVHIVGDADYNRINFAFLNDLRDSRKSLFCPDNRERKGNPLDLDCESDFLRSVVDGKMGHILVLNFYFHVHSYVYVASEVDFDVGGSDFLEVVSFREEDMFFLEFDSVEVLDLHDNLMFTDPAKYLVSRPGEFKSKGRIV